MTPLTLDEFKAALPDKMRKSINQELVDRVNGTITQPEEYEHFRSNLIGFTKVLQDGKWTAQEYISAVKYISFKLMGCTHIDAYSRTFPEKIARFNAEGVVAKDIASYVTAYNKSKLVNLIYAQTLIPAYVYNQDLFQRALNVQADLMMNAKSEKVRAEAANSLLSHLKQPEVKKVELDIGTKEDDSIKALREATVALVAQQRQAILSGQMNAGEIAHQKVVMDPDAIDVEAKVLA